MRYNLLFIIIISYNKILEKHTESNVFTAPIAGPNSTMVKVSIRELKSFFITWIWICCLIPYSILWCKTPSICICIPLRLRILVSVHVVSHLKLKWEWPNVTTMPQKHHTKELEMTALSAWCVNMVRAFWLDLSVNSDSTSNSCTRVHTCVFITFVRANPEYHVRF